LKETTAPDYNGLIKTKKHNIDTEEETKMAIIRDYWYKEMVTQVVDLLKEYEDLFPQRFSEMKGIVGSLGAMKIQLKPDAKLFKRRPYHLNPKYKEKVRKELDQMFDVRIIVPVEKSKWIIPMALQPKNTVEIHICVYLRSLNVACIHDPFLTHFTNEVLENVGSRESYSSIDGFLGYHQVLITEEDQAKTTFATEWGSFVYTIMHFGLKNAPVVFSRIVVAIFKEFIHKFLEV